ncbi:basic leucine zipper 43 [Punica granatum]|uniref:BZIP domain-containing protein n=2 Tax=Punica granatum TaxID=22663 RepID=A0A218VW74_PUNGR|nr:basic leucine zipper 43 [Punica granatum]OWM64468.1 hypothetical protein CDL15_Pgr020435 [Punica granatum]PKI75576.1 hypothetical protein CRG98_003977 [Punica granatum]
MELSEVSGLNYLLPSSSSSSVLFPPHHLTNASHDQVSALAHFSNNRSLVYTAGSFQAPPSGLFSQEPNSTSDEAEDQQLNVINERKQRRMISNRESARRSRMRKQRHLDELWSQVVWLRNENYQLIDKLNHVSEVHDKVLEENAQLKREASELRQLFTDMQLDNTYSSLRDLDEVSCNTAHLRAESSNQSLTSSMDLLG